ncbi:N-acyl-D-amino-acid deacylase family protein [Variovorax arabinosiphilus]|uniref:N-acyl-D-amino-acid deacylase family protein n=1 Tax=Variovorax arabinosiphilus TaxID=3053498 RepID=UPI002575950C|nr:MULTISPECIES: amidohydrolase family protein [unclassified Variovorax]MDM0119682.1 amidohydrolase family protein [Variovorax sp. J2L1-78]MDM0128406.1 amidohydrolase family protein [Variovorax sp. J2L1-63]MDM0232106.1 amidohydrolase family protein [Variovorax sp. J2R1-6]
MADFDLLLRHGTLIDGTGAARRSADVGIRGARVAAIGDLSGQRGAAEIDAAGRIVAPGFIDSHTHDDRYLLLDPDMPAKLSQGVTTVVTGNCGISLAPWGAPAGATVPPPLNLLGHDPALFGDATFAAYLARLEAAPAAVNAACLVGHTTLRAATMPQLDCAATPEEIAHMRALLDEAMASGAIGLSTGAAYPTAMPATTDEMAQVAEVIGAYGGVYASHIRDEGDHVFAALDEAFAIGRAVDAPVVVSHHKLIGPRNHGRSVHTLAHVRAAMAHQSIALDCYPYCAGSTILRKDRIPVSSRIIVTTSQPHPEFAGMDLDVIAQRLGVSMEDAVDRLLPAGAIYFLMDEADVRRVLAFPQTMIGSDGMPHDTAPHPRLWGTFPRVLGHYCRDVGLFSLEEAVHKMTGLTARHFRLPGRGVLREGAFADITVFDADRVADRATWDAPTLRAEGIDTVIVNGRPAWQDGRALGVRSGRVVRLTDAGLPR